jgi:hypothetical protein
MDEMGILLMSEQLRAALGEDIKRVEQPEGQLPGRWSRKVAHDARDAAPDEIHILARIVRCAATRSGKIRLILDVHDETTAPSIARLVESVRITRITAGDKGQQVSLAGRVRSVKLRGGSPMRASILLDPAA